MKKNHFTLWVIDDDMVSQFAIRYKIQQSIPNCQLIEFYSVEEALFALKKCSETKMGLPDKILLDLVLPGMNGWSFLERIEKIQLGFRPIDIYVVSAFSNTEDRIRAKKNPLVKGHFSKPINSGCVEKMFVPGPSRANESQF